MKLIQKLIILITVFKFCLVLAGMQIGYKRMSSIQSNVCPHVNVIKNVSFVSKMECLNICAGKSDCSGVFFQSVNQHCILCSARYLTQENTNQSENYTFYGKIIFNSFNSLRCFTLYYLTVISNCKILL
jgi:hypothetical protein